MSSIDPALAEKSMEIISKTCGDTGLETNGENGKEDTEEAGLEVSVEAGVDTG